jgi:hypothetical protein
MNLPSETDGQGGTQMACEIIKIEDSVIHVRISDVMRVEDQKMLESVAMDLIGKGKKVRLLAISENFRGWEKSDAWGDMGFMLKYGNDIAKIALVGDERWKEDTFLFVAKGLRSTEIEFFPLSSLMQAEEWVRETPASNLW